MGLMLDERLAVAQRELEQHQQLVALAQDERRRLVLEACKAGWTPTQLAGALTRGSSSGVTPQRASQLMLKLAGESADTSRDG